MDQQQLKKEITAIVDYSCEIDLHNNMDVQQTIEKIVHNKLYMTPYGQRFKMRLEDALKGRYVQ